MMFGMNLARCPTRRDSYRNHAEAGPADKIFAGCFFFIESRSAWRADRLSFPNESHVSTNTQQRELPGSECRTIPHSSTIRQCSSRGGKALFAAWTNGLRFQVRRLLSNSLVFFHIKNGLLWAAMMGRIVQL